MLKHDLAVLLYIALIGLKPSTSPAEMKPSQKEITFV